MEKPAKNIKIAVGLSGGVDSSVAAYLLKKAGYQVIGIFMKNWNEGVDSGYCTVAEDLFDAKCVCEKLDIPFYPVDFTKDYQEKVFAYFLKEYQAGNTPNPDILCNREIKFDQLLHYAKQLGADLLATGHYARKDCFNGKPSLLKAIDSNKDQSYFLSQITSNQLADALFPLGDLHKNEVREIALQAGLNTFDKKDSTGICFIGERPFRQFLEQYLSGNEGDIVDFDSQKVIGRHQGLMFYTIGQRQGLGIGGSKNHHLPWYVAEKDYENNRLVVVNGDHPALYHQKLWAKDCSFLNEIPKSGARYFAKIRYRQTDQACTVYWQDELLLVEFDNPQRAVTLGQYLVIYQDSRCLGGGVISKRGN